jgi:cell division inhibitor SepF
MSFWDNVKKFAQPYADDEFDEFDDVEDGFEDEAEPAPRQPRKVTAEPAMEPAPERSEAPGFSGKVLNINSNKPSVVLFRPTKYGECTKAADDLRARKAVIVNMEDVDASTACRVVDFLSGCAYALDGKVRKIASDTYLFCPQSMDVMGDLETISTETEATV